MKVYLDYTQAELDRAYDQRAWAGNRDAMLEWYARESAQTRAAYEHHYDVSYGPSPDETLDIFTCSTPRAPIHVHVHGGGWRNLTKDDESFLARTFVPAGALCVVLNFSLIPHVRLPEMVAQARRAIAWIHANADRFGGDAARIHVSGHSSGAHMASVLATTDWTAFGLPADVIKSALLVSGMYDLRPVMLSARSDYVKLSNDEMLELSALLHLDRLRAPLAVAFGATESPEFKRQAESFAAAVESAGKPCTLARVEGVGHFDILCQLGERGTPLARLALRLMGLAP